MKRLMVVMALTCVLSASVFAGDVPSGGFAPPVPTDGCENTTIVSKGDIPTTGFAHMTIQEELLNGILGFVSLMTP